MVRVKTKQKKVKQETPPPNPLGRAGQLLVGRAKVLAALAVVALLGWAMHGLWQRFAPQISLRDNYLLADERITITALPEWITGDVRGEAIRNAGLVGRVSVLDEAFAQVVEDAFELHPWVDSVDKITKSYPAGVHVDITYRRPVAVVELVAQNVVQLLPVDRDGVHLPSADVPNIRKQYLPRIGGVIERPLEGQTWSDLRVIGAAELAEQLTPVWESLHLVDILPSARPEIRSGHRYFVFDLITRGGTRIIWGAAPSAAPPDEHKVAEKLERLKLCARQHGPLDSVRGPAEIDVREKLMIRPRTVKKTKTKDAGEAIVK